MAGPHSQGQPPLPKLRDRDGKPVALEHRYNMKDDRWQELGQASARANQRWAILNV